MNMDNNQNKIYKVDYNRTFLNEDVYHRWEKESPTNKIRRALIIFSLISIIITIGLLILIDSDEFFAKVFGENSKLKTVMTTLFSNSEKQHADFGTPFALKRQNILILGVDDNPDSSDLWSGTRTDTIIVANLDPKTRSINAISIPRDSKVFLAGNKGINKINSAHALGGIEMTQKTIEKTLGIKIHRFVLVHENIIKELVDGLGGIEIYIEKPMHYQDKTAHLTINFKKGKQKLNGQKAVEYLRFRHDQLGDIGRTQRQQWFIRGFIKTLQEPKSLPKIPELITIARKYIKTDISVGEMTQYVDFLRSIDLSKTEIATLPGQPNQSGFISYWILDPEKTQEVVDRLIYRDKFKQNGKSQPIIANIMYAKGKKEKANALIEEFNTQGIEVKCIDTANRSHSQFIAHTNRITNDYYNMLSEKTENLNKVQFVYDPINLYCAGTDFTVILAEE